MNKLFSTVLDSPEDLQTVRTKKEVSKMEVTTLTRNGKELTYSRVIDAPRDLAWKVMTDPRFLAQHFGTNSVTVLVDRWEFREGGTGRMIRIDEDGQQYVLEGKIKRIIPNQRIKYDIELDSEPRHKLIQLETLEDFEGKTKYEVCVQFESEEEKDRMLRSGWGEVIAESINRFARLVNSLNGK